MWADNGLIYFVRAPRAPLNSLAEVCDKYTLPQLTGLIAKLGIEMSSATQLIKQLPKQMFY
jgi:hypothetical protein